MFIWSTNIPTPHSGPESNNVCCSNFLNLVWVKVWVWELGAAEAEVNQIEFDREKTETHGAESQLAKWSEVYNLRHRIRRHC